MKTNQSQLKITLRVLPFLVLLLIFACSKEGSTTDDPDVIGQTDDDPGDNDVLTLNNVLSRAAIEDYPATRTADTLEVFDDYFEDYEEPNFNGADINYRYKCTSKKLSVLDGNGKFPLFNPNAEVIWPGNLLQGNSLNNNTPSTINVDRAGGTVSYNLINGNPVSAISVDGVKKSSIQTAMNEIIANDPDIVPANFQLEVEEVFSEEQMALEIGISFESYNINASGNLSFSSDKQYNRVLVKLTQQYYTMSMDQINGLDDIFAPSVTGDDLDPFVQPNNPATFISSVTYGRIFYMLVESTSSINELKTRVEGTYKGFDKKVEGEVDYEQYNALKEVKTKIIAYGGSAESAFELSGELDINVIGAKLAESTNITEAMPLSYVVRSVQNPSQIVGTKLATEYDFVQCELYSKGTAPVQTRHWEGEVLDLLGPVGAATVAEKSKIILISKDGKRYVVSDAEAANKLEGPYPIEDLGDIIDTDSSYPFGEDGIGAIYNTDGNRDYNSSRDIELIVFSQDGLFWSVLRNSGQEEDGINSLYWLDRRVPVSSSAGFADNPFITDGIGAAIHRTGVTEGNDHWFINQQGTEYALRSDGDYQEVKPISKWGRNDTLPFQKVGAAMSMYIGDTRYYILFNEEGTQYSINSKNNDFDNEGPFDL
ncbi:thiol-activated cytolysin family protein [Maribacter sp. 2308TA10-17]|uniref:thiol-activated cytolysin family protein n=1 Tax=Maribacter sp. 2308TA10-17 TaxID=3386276 RepID=UPI0039BC2C05